MSDVVTLTLNPCLDQITSVDRVQPNRKLRMDPPRYEPGGGGINVSRAIRRLGGDTVACYTAGGPTGDHLERQLQAELVPQMRVTIDQHTRINPNVLEHDSNDLYRFIMPGPTLDSQVVEHCLERVVHKKTQSTYVVISGSLPRGLSEQTYRTLVESLQRHNHRVVLDASGSALQQGIRGGPYLIKPNFRELSELLGKEPENDQDVENGAVELIREHGVEVVLATLGAHGAMLVTESQRIRIHPPAVNVRSRIGAGDSVVAAISMRLAEGWALTDAARYAVAAGASAVMTPGTELCRQQETERLFADTSARPTSDNKDESKS